MGVALVTLFDDDGGVDAAATADHAARLVDEGARGIVVGGSTGEAATLDTEERLALLKAVRDGVGGRVPVVGGTGAPSARQAVALSRRAAEAGADALLVLSPPRVEDPRPYYDAVVGAVDVPVLAYHFPSASAPGIPVVAGTGAPSARQAVALSRRAAEAGADALLVLSPPRVEDPRPYYDAVVGAVDVPVLAYHFPSASAPGIPVDVVGELPVAGMKDSTGDPFRLAIELDAMPVGLYVGSPALLLQAAAMGASGAILALANLDVAGCVQAWEGDGACQRELVNGHRADALAGVRSLKRALAGAYGTSPVTRVG